MPGIGWLLLLVAGAALLWFSTRRRTQSGPVRAGKRAARSASRPTAGDVQSSDSVEAAEAVPAEAEVPEPPEALTSFHLVTTDELDQPARVSVQQLCERMAVPHPVQKQLARGLDEPEALVQVVASDAGLTARVLRKVNSAAFALASPISSVQHAITYLGVTMVKGLVAEAAIAETTGEGTPEQQAAVGRIWKSARGASAMAQTLGQELGLSRPSVLATRSLFHNIGDVAIVLGLPGAHAWYGEGRTLLERLHAQQTANSVNSPIVGGALARHWMLPPDIAFAIEQGLLPLVTPPSQHPLEGEERMANVLIYLSCCIGERVAYGDFHDVGDLEPDFAAAPDLFHLGGHLDRAGLGRVPSLLREPSFRRRANGLLASLDA